MSTPLPEEKLERVLGLAEAVALNMNAMVGIGPFIVIPLVIQAMGGPQCLLAWVAGAALSVVDGLVWAELGAAMPRAPRKPEITFLWSAWRRLLGSVDTWWRAIPDAPGFPR